MKEISGGYCGGVPPLPIPNREVKPTCADGTAMQCGRVGSRLLLQSSALKTEMFSGLFRFWEMAILFLIHGCFAWEKSLFYLGEIFITFWGNYHHVLRKLSFRFREIHISFLGNGCFGFYTWLFCLNKTEVLVWDSWSFDCCNLELCLYLMVILFGRN